MTAQALILKNGGWTRYHVSIAGPCHQLQRTSGRSHPGRKPDPARPSMGTAISATMQLHHTYRHMQRPLDRNKNVIAGVELTGARHIGRCNPTDAAQTNNSHVQLLKSATTAD